MRGKSVNLHSPANMVNKRMIKWAATIAVLIVIVIIALKIFNRYAPSGRNALLKKAVPGNSAFFFEIRNAGKLSDVISKLSYTVNFSKLPVMQKLTQYFETLKPLTDKNDDWKNTLFNHTIISSFQMVGENNFDLILLLDFSNSGEPDFEKQLKDLHLEFEPRTFRGETIYEINFQSVHLSVGFLNKVCMISSTASLTEDAMSQMLGRSSITASKSFADLSSHLSDNFEATLFINYSNLADFIVGYSQPDSNDYSSGISGFAEWSAFDFDFTKNGIGVSGITTSSQTSSWLNQFDETARLNSSLPDFIPDNAAWVASVPLTSNSVFDKLNSSLQSDPDFRRYIKPWLGNEIDFVLTEPVSENLSAQSFLLFNGIDSAKAIKILANWSLIKSGGDSSVISSYKNYSILQLKIGDDFRKYFPDKLIHVTNPFCCIMNHTLLTANSIGQLKLYIDKLLDKNTVSKTDFEKSSFANSQYSLWFNPSRLKDFLSSVASDNLKQNFNSLFEMVRSCNSVAIPFIMKENYYESKGWISFSDKENTGEGYAWKTILDTSAVLAPQVLVNSTGNKIVMTQDAHDVLYCLNKGGDILWKRKLDSKVMSEIFQLDLYHNGEQQYVLNTSGGIYLFDEEGKDINNFPIRLAAPATSPLSLIDFDGKQQFKLFVACSNGSIYGFEKTGRPLGGWNPNSGNGNIEMPVQFFHSGKTEFLAAVDVSGKLLLFDRNGKRVAKEIKTGLEISAPVILGKKNQLLAIDSTGKIFELSPEGKQKQYSLIGENAIAAQMFTNDSSDVIIELLSGNKLLQFKNDSSQVFSFDFNDNNISTFHLLTWNLSGEKFTLLSDESGQKIYLINTEGKLLTGFPKQGTQLSALTDLFGNGNATLITVRNSNEIIAYQIELSEE